MDIYFMTGTGNSFWAASRLKELSELDGKNASLIPIDGLKKANNGPVKNDLAGFIYPTHGFSLPWYMLKFILRFPRGNGKIFLVNSRAGMKLSRIFTPGISGIAVLLPMLIFFLKGYTIIGTLPLDTPSNWISVHPGLRPKIIKSIFDRRELDVQRLWKRLNAGKLYFPMKFLIPVPLDIFLVPVSIGYMFFGRFLLARTYMPDNNCDGCGICAKFCPVGAIKMKGSLPYWTYKCESCMRCSNVCPKRSINSSVPLMFLFTWILIWLTDINGLLREFWIKIHDIGGITSDVISFLSNWIITLIMTYIMYIIIFHLRKINIISTILAYTTPMKYWRHYMTPGFKGKYRTLGKDELR